MEGIIPVPVCLEKPIKNALVKVDYAFAENSSLDISSGTDCFQIEGKDVKHKWGQFLADITRHGDQILDVAVDGEGEFFKISQFHVCLEKEIQNAFAENSSPDIFLSRTSVDCFNLGRMLHKASAGGLLFGMKAYGKLSFKRKCKYFILLLSRCG
ncbi:hypothetical protein L6452_37441 [Arctium lappa]|uniref:Uncharacterized protein n=1 Tax=Arctium lappa TaxID=4217 RepID=A0ACB8Y2Z6_ARCLA|nr:hypothetical protein L6452_37441 [Arctium lappa]